MFKLRNCISLQPILAYPTCNFVVITFFALISFLFVLKSIQLCIHKAHFPQSCILFTDCAPHCDKMYLCSIKQQMILAFIFHYKENHVYVVLIKIILDCLECRILSSGNALNHQMFCYKISRYFMHIKIIVTTT